MNKIMMFFVYWYLFFSVMFSKNQVPVPRRVAPLEAKLRPLPKAKPVVKTEPTGVDKYGHEIVATIESHRETIRVNSLSDSLFAKQLWGFILSPFKTHKDLLDSLSIIGRTFDRKLEVPSEQVYLDAENVTIRPGAVTDVRLSSYLNDGHRAISIRKSYVTLDEHLRYVLERYYAILNHDHILAVEKIYYSKQIGRIMRIVADYLTIVLENGKHEPTEERTSLSKAFSDAGQGFISSGQYLGSNNARRVSTPWDYWSNNGALY